MVVLIATTAMLTMGGALMVLTTTETRIAANYRDGVEAFYAADAALELVLPHLYASPDWDAVLSGGARSPFTDGPPNGGRTLQDGAGLNLADVVNMARCGRAEACRAAEMGAYSEERPSGPNNPRWTPYAYGRLRELLPARLDSAAYIVVLVGDDPFETDDDPLRDGQPGSPGRGALLLRAHAYGPQGVHRMLEAIVSRGEHGMRVVSQQELR